MSTVGREEVAGMEKKKAFEMNPEGASTETGKLRSRQCRGKFEGREQALFSGDPFTNFWRILFLYYLMSTKYADVLCPSILTHAGFALFQSHPYSCE